ncbi:Hypothetical protein, putative [Bodo saltans]|uniref:Uncharacterized protein n=1 Tax=Bodo saltans TaxID=75058 RepID=A0A0S4IU77_BODSA|nr:Hypothetical protein, putative [Bodo saltans]|eukprot:CUF94562.1 Hypothetical protein, putative [Bodo saltans]
MPCQHQIITNSESKCFRDQPPHPSECSTKRGSSTSPLARCVVEQAESMRSEVSSQNATAKIGAIRSLSVRRCATSRHRRGELGASPRPLWGSRSTSHQSQSVRRQISLCVTDGNNRNLHCNHNISLSGNSSRKATPAVSLLKQRKQVASPCTPSPPPRPPMRFGGASSSVHTPNNSDTHLHCVSSQSSQKSITIRKKPDHKNKVRPTSSLPVGGSARGRLVTRSLPSLHVAAVRPVSVSPTAARTRNFFTPTLLSPPVVKRVSSSESKTPSSGYAPQKSLRSLKVCAQRNGARLHELCQTGLPFNNRSVLQSPPSFPFFDNDEESASQQQQQQQQPQGCNTSRNEARAIGNEEVDDAFPESRIRFASPRSAPPLTTLASHPRTTVTLSPVTPRGVSSSQQQELCDEQRRLRSPIKRIAVVLRHQPEETRLLTKNNHNMREIVCGEGSNAAAVQSSFIMSLVSSVTGLGKSADSTPPRSNEKSGDQQGNVSTDVSPPSPAANNYPAAAGDQEEEQSTHSCTKRLSFNTSSIVTHSIAHPAADKHYDGDYDGDDAEAEEETDRAALPPCASQALLSIGGISSICAAEHTEESGIVDGESSNWTTRLRGTAQLMGATKQHKEIDDEGEDYSSSDCSPPSIHHLVEEEGGETRNGGRFVQPVCSAAATTTPPLVPACQDTTFQPHDDRASPSSSPTQHSQYESFECASQVVREYYAQREKQQQQQQQEHEQRHLHSSSVETHSTSAMAPLRQRQWPTSLADKSSSSLPQNFIQETSCPIPPFVQALHGKEDAVAVAVTRNISAAASNMLRAFQEPPTENWTCVNCENSFVPPTDPHALDHFGVRVPLQHHPRVCDACISRSAMILGLDANTVLRRMRRGDAIALSEQSMLLASSSCMNESPSLSKRPRRDEDDTGAGAPAIAGNHSSVVTAADRSCLPPLSPPVVVTATSAGPQDTRGSLVFVGLQVAPPHRPFTFPHATQLFATNEHVAPHFLLVESNEEDRGNYVHHRYDDDQGNRTATPIRPRLRRRRRVEFVDTSQLSGISSDYSGDPPQQLSRRNAWRRNATHHNHHREVLRLQRRADEGHRHHDRVEDYESGDADGHYHQQSRQAPSRHRRQRNQLDVRMNGQRGDVANPVPQVYYAHERHNQPFSAPVQQQQQRQQVVFYDPYNPPHVRGGVAYLQPYVVPPMSDDASRTYLHHLISPFEQQQVGHYDAAAAARIVVDGDWTYAHAAPHLAPRRAQLQQQLPPMEFPQQQQQQPNVREYFEHERPLPEPRGPSRHLPLSKGFLWGL